MTLRVLVLTLTVNWGDSITAGEGSCKQLVTSSRMYTIIPATNSYHVQWSALRHQLWSDLSPQEHHQELLGLEPGAHHLALDEQGQVVAFVEAGLRHDYVNGCETSPVAFLEGLFVLPQHRQRGRHRIETGNPHHVKPVSDGVR